MLRMLQLKKAMKVPPHDFIYNTKLKEKLSTEEQPKGHRYVIIVLCLWAEKSNIHVHINIETCSYQEECILYFIREGMKENQAEVGRSPPHPKTTKNKNQIHVSLL